MMYQMMTPYRQNPRQMQMCAPQSTYMRQLAQPRQTIQHMSPPNVLPVNANPIPMPRPMYLPNTIIPQRTIINPMLKSCVDQPPLMLANPTAMPNSPLASSVPYSCHFLGQLEGNYETDAPEAEQIKIVLAGEQYAIVRRACPGGKDVPDQVIYAENTRFTLYSLDGYIEGVLPKGACMKHNVTWYTNDGTLMVWRQRGQVSFKLTSVTPTSSRRNSISSELSTTSQMSSTSVGPSDVVLTDVSMRIRPELRQQNQQSDEELTTSTGSKSSYTTDNSRPSTSTETDERVSDDALLALFQSNCIKHPSILQKVLTWGIPRAEIRQVGEKEISEVSEGRVWVCARLSHPAKEEDVEKFEEILDNFRGVYKEVDSGVYLQPPSPNEPGVQHRLRRSTLGLWMIEEHNLEKDVWRPCAKEHPYGHWVDLKNNGKWYKVQIVPMLSIVNRMKKEWLDVEEMEKTFEILFKPDLKIRNLKLKERNLKHSISNLLAFSFADRVASIADSIALELQKVSSKENNIAGSVALEVQEVCSKENQSSSKGVTE